MTMSIIHFNFAKSRFYRPSDNERCISSQNNVASYLRSLVYQSGRRVERTQTSYLFYRPEGSIEPSSFGTLFHSVRTSLIKTTVYRRRVSVPINLNRSAPRPTGGRWCKFPATCLLHERRSESLSSRRKLWFFQQKNKVRRGRPAHTGTYLLNIQSSRAFSPIPRRRPAHPPGLFSPQFPPPSSGGRSWSTTWKRRIPAGVVKPTRLRLHVRRFVARKPA